MASNEEREKHAQRRKHNIYAKVLHEHRKLYGPRVIDSQKIYKREKLNPRDIVEEEEE